MSPIIIVSIILAYFLLLIAISYITGKKDSNEGFFTGNKKSPWFIVAFGMVGASLSGVTFISVPGWVGSSNFSYMQMVLGYLVGYLVVANILLPLYYRLNLVSIYTYLDKRFGFWSYKTGAFYFLLSRTIGAAFRLFLVANVLQITVFNHWGIPFFVTVMVTIILIWLYTFKGGIKTIIWTDTLQTLFMLIAVGLSIYFISDKMNLNFSALIDTVKDSEYSQIFYFDDYKDSKFFFKQFFAGMFITIVMTGLDQDMMQKNLTCKNIGEAKKNMYWFSIILVFVNVVFLSLGALLFIFAKQNAIEIPEATDDLFPLIATGEYLSPVVSIFFIIGLIAAAYSSADSALTSLTTSFSIDFLNVKKLSKDTAKKYRKYSHIGFSLLLFVVILIFSAIKDENVISSIFKAAGFTYGPLLGLYAFGLFTKLNIKDKFVPIITLFSPILSYLIYKLSPICFNGYEFGFEILIVNGMLTFLGLFIISDRKNVS